MSFCQKHLNHHCIHAHECKNSKHQHQPPQQPQQNISKQYKRRQNAQSSCTFVGVQIPKTLKENCEVEESQSSIFQLKRTVSLLEEKERALKTENKHLLIQIQYYREQFSGIVGTNSSDTKNLIKKGLKESTELQLKIRNLTSQNVRLRQENEGLRQFLHDDKINRQSNKHINFDLEEKYSSVYQNLKATARERDQLLSELQRKDKQQLRWEEKYQILKKQFEFESSKMMRSIQALEINLQSTKKEQGYTKKVAERQKELGNIEITSKVQKETLYQDKLRQYETQKQELRRNVKELTQRCHQMAEDLLHTKALIEKNLHSSKEVQNLSLQMKERDLQTKTVVKEKTICYEGKENLGKEDEHQRLRQEIDRLKVIIEEMERREMVNLQEVVMNIGASEAFKRLVEEKNTMIKRLIRQKGEIYTKIVYAQV